METLGLSFELARSIGNETRKDTWLGDDGRWGLPAEGICSLLDAMVLDDSQLLRLRADPFDDLSWRKTLKYHCHVASESQSFYISNSRMQWLRTSIKSPKPAEIFVEDKSEANLIIHSNIVPRQAYFKDSCLNPEHCRGFVRASVIVDGLKIPSPLNCENCTLAKQLQNRFMSAEDLEPSRRLWWLNLNEVEFVDDLGGGSGAKVSKIQWRKGVFVRKRFNSEVAMKIELDVALRVSHPNIVHCFGCSRRTDSTDCDLFMELLDVDLYMFLFEQSGTRNEGSETGSEGSDTGNEESDTGNEGSETGNEGSEAGNKSLLLFRDVLDVLLQVAQAMEHLHEKNFVHGDLKPHNIFLRTPFELAHSGVPYFLAKVGDFGCAQRVDSLGAAVEAFNFKIGTLCYTAPEVLRCRFRKGPAVPPKCPQKIDVYSFGVVAYQVLTMTPKLYDGCKSLAEEVIRGVRPDVNLKKKLDGDRSSLLSLIRSCWAPNPEDRPSFTKICDILEKLQKKNPKRKHRRFADAFGNLLKKNCCRPEHVLLPELSP